MGHPTKPTANQLDKIKQMIKAKLRTNAGKGQFTDFSNESDDKQN